jgi:hypothetical protein
MGVEPTMAASAAPINGFEDRGAHRDSTTPTTLIAISFVMIHYFRYLVKPLEFLCQSIMKVKCTSSIR